VSVRIVRSPEDGRWVVEIETDPEVPEDSDGPLMRVWLNDARLHPEES
jgi:hypothetical protein